MIFKIIVNDFFPVAALLKKIQSLKATASRRFCRSNLTNSVAWKENINIFINIIVFACQPVHFFKVRIRLRPVFNVTSGVNFNP
jgi:hypothetical protein